MFDKLKKEYYNEIKALRRDLHKIPEEGLKEIKTSAYIRDYLDKLNLKWEPSAETGTLVFFEAGSKDAIAFRADIDGLSIKEENDIDFKSEHSEMMHACGHDGHTSILLIFAKYLKENKDKLKQNVLLIFQPAEEGPGGAKIMVEDEKILEKYNVKNVFGLHLQCDYEQGTVACKAGKMFASTSEFYVTVKGSAAHAATPNNGRDAIVAASAFVTAVQSVISRNIDPREEGVVSIGTINGGDRVNIIPAEVKLNATMRTFDKETKAIIVKRIEEIAKGIGTAYDCQIDVEFNHLYPAIINDKNLFEKIKPAFGDKFVLSNLNMTAEDFAFFSEAVPSVYFLVGIRNEEKGMIYPWHTSRFNFDEEALITALEADISILKTIGAL